MPFLHQHKKFKNAQDAFVHYFYKINNFGIEVGNGTKALMNIGFYIMDPSDNLIQTPYRKWNKNYAEREWAWYLSKNRSVKQLKKFAPIWDKMHNGDDIVNSNYGHLWSEEDQLQKTIDLLKKEPTTRRAYVTLFDGKNKDQYDHDTPCTLSVGFNIINEKLCMNVIMRSNDIWFGFCNDQYCFSKLQQLVADELDRDVGWYYHYAADLHVYEQQYLK